MNIIDVYQNLFGKDHIRDGDVISMAEHGRVGGTSVGQGFKFYKDVDQGTKITVVGKITYIGIAPPGTDQASALWQCKKIDETTGTVITFADGNSNYDNVATDLTALSYS